MSNIPQSKFIAKDNGFSIDLASTFQYDNIERSPKTVLHILNDIKIQITNNLNNLTNIIYRI